MMNAEPGMDCYLSRRRIYPKLESEEW